MSGLDQTFVCHRVSNEGGSLRFTHSTVGPILVARYRATKRVRPFQTRSQLIAVSIGRGVDWRP